MADSSVKVVNMDLEEMKMQVNLNKINDEDEILLMLRRHERKARDGSQRALIPGKSDSDKSDKSHMEDIPDNTNKNMLSKVDTAKALSAKDEGDSNLCVFGKKT